MPSDAGRGYFCNAGTGSQSDQAGLQTTGLRLTCPSGTDPSVVCDVLLELGCLSASVLINDKEGYVYTDEEFEKTGALDLSSHADAVIVEACAMASCDPASLAASLSDIFDVGNPGGTCKWSISTLPSSAGEASDSFPPQYATGAPPAHEEVIVGDSRLVITSGNFTAFGDGRHSSTRLCLNQLERLAPKLAGASVLDFGAGTGVLGLAALALGARHATLVELDPASLAIAAENVARNGRQGQVDLKSKLADETHPPLRTGREGSSANQEHDRPQSFEVVVANMPANTLLAVMDELVAALRPGGRGEAGRSSVTPHSDSRPVLVLAGFPASEGDTVREALLQRIGALISFEAAQVAETSLVAIFEAGWLSFRVEV